MLHLLCYNKAAVWWKRSNKAVLTHYHLDREGIFQLKSRFVDCMLRLKFLTIPVGCVRETLIVGKSALVRGSDLDLPLIARFMGPSWGPSGADRTQVGSMLAPWTLLPGTIPYGVTKPQRVNSSDSKIYDIIRVMCRCHVDCIDQHFMQHWDTNKMADILQTFSNAFSWMKTFEFQLEFHWNMLFMV